MDLTASAFPAPMFPSKKMSIKLIDNSGIQVQIPDPPRFHQHILQFHSRGTSIHDENGLLLTLDDAFRENLERLMRAFRIPDKSVLLHTTPHNPA